MMTAVDACRAFLTRNRMAWQELDEGLGIAFNHRGFRFLLLDYKENDPQCFQLILPEIFQPRADQHDSVYRVMNARNEDRKYIKLYLDEFGAVNVECQMLLDPEPKLELFFFRLLESLLFEQEHFVRHLRQTEEEQPA